jgi:hypothetical protein
LETLEVDDNQLASPDISKNSKLKTLDISRSLLERLFVPKKIILKDLKHSPDQPAGGGRVFRKTRGPPET